MLTLAPTVNLALSLTYDPVDHVDSFTIAMPLSVPGAPQRFTYQGNELFEGESFFVDSPRFQISYLAGDGNNIAIYAVSEPASALLITTALASVLGLGRRRSRRLSARSSRRQE